MEFFLKQKSDQASVLTHFAKDLIKNMGVKIKNWRMDNAGENYSTERLFKEEGLGINVEYTARETPQHNGQVERGFASLYGRVIAMLNHAGFEGSLRSGLWHECASTATKIDNILVEDKKENSPYEQFYGESPKYEKYLRKFGELGVVTISNTNKMKGKLSDRGITGIFVGYARNHSGNTYRMYNPKTKKVWITRDIIWLNKMYGENKIKEKGSDLTREIEIQGNEKVKQEIEYDQDDDNEQQEENEIPVEQTEKQRRPRWQQNLQTFYNPTPGEIAEIALLSMLQGGNEPHTFNEAWNHPDMEQRKKWRDAIRKEFRDMINRGVWRYRKRATIESDQKLIGNKWVFKIKKNGVFRARLVALGYSQIPGVDFTDNYAPVVNDVTIRVVLVLYYCNNWYVESIDIETAFLYGELEEKIYMKVPDGLMEIETEDLEGKCLELEKSIYGLVQSARQFAKHFFALLSKIGFKSFGSDNCLMMRKDEEGIVVICVYVDDVLCFGNEESVKEAIKEIEKLYKVKRTGNLGEFIGVTMEKTTTGICCRNPIPSQKFSRTSNSRRWMSRKLFKHQQEQVKAY